MANGVSLSPAKTIVISLMLTVAVNGVFLVMHQEHGDEIAALRLKHATDIKELKGRLEAMTGPSSACCGGRYRQSDAQRDFRLVEFRFERNERNIDKCVSHIEEHTR